MKSMFRVDTARDWESYGRSNPYFGVLAHEKFLGKSLNDDTHQEFFRSGEEHIDKCLSTLNDVFGYTPEGTAMDFGCGVGRLATALSRRFDHVVGFDVSASMLETARLNADKMGRRNIEYICTSENFDVKSNSFDMIHSYLVLQHIPVAQGMSLIGRMLDGLREGGVGALHLTFADATPSLKARVKKLAKSYYLPRALWNIARFKHPASPSMQMNNYDLNDVFALLHSYGVDRFFCDRIDDWGNVGLYIFFRKSAGSRSLWSNPKH